MDFITNLFTQMGTRDSLLVLLFLLVAFLIGLVTGWLYWRKRLEELRTELTHTQKANLELGKQLDDWKGKWEVTNAELQACLAQLEKSKAQFKNCEIEKGQLRAEIYEATEKLAAIQASSDDGSGAVSIAQAAVASVLGGRVKAVDANERDDLKKISGVGPFIEKKLNNLGIYTFEQISQFDDDLVEKVNIAIEFFPGRIARDNWVGQASALFRAKAGGQE